MLQLLQEDVQGLILPLSEIVTLDNSGIPGGTFAMRELNETHVVDLTLSKYDDWLPVRVTSTSLGYLLYDGYHRREAAKRLGLGGLKATCRTFKTENDVIEATFRSNLTHGLKASVETRSDYAYWLHITYKLTQEEIAKRVGITQSAVSRAITRREIAAHNAMLETQEERHTWTPKEIKSTCRNLTRKLVQFTEEIETVQTEEILKGIKSVIKTEEDKAKIARIAQLLLDSVSPGPTRQFKLRQPSHV